MTRLERIARARLESRGLDPDAKTWVDVPGNSAMGPAWKDVDNLVEARRFMMMFEAAMGDTE